MTSFMNRDVTGRSYEEVSEDTLNANSSYHHLRHVLSLRVSLNSAHLLPQFPVIRSAPVSPLIPPFELLDSDIVRAIISVSMYITAIG